MPTPIKQASDVAPGDFYEDCAFHPCLCIRVDGEVNGISLVDGSYPRGCSIFGCAIRKLTFEEALQWKFRGPPDVEFAEDARWWPVERLLGYEFLRGRSDVLRDAPGSQGSSRMRALRIPHIRSRATPIFDAQRLPAAG